MRIALVLVLVLVSIVEALGSARGKRPEELLTVAEASGWRATSTHAQVVDLCRRLAASSPRIHMEVAGETSEGRSLPILVVAEPPVASPEDVGDRLVAFAWAGIHSGEVCGKPATLMLARELAATAGHPLLEGLVVVFLPLLNADGNDRMSPDNRPGQKGPVEGMGTRPNAAGLNINRDFTKLETREAQAIARILTRWDPAVVMDLHTTNGSRHQYVLTFDGPRHPASAAGIRRLARDELLPAVRRSIEAETGYKTFFYGNFSRKHTQWRTYPAAPRYSTHYLGLRHHVGLLSEAYSYASYQDRVMSTIAYVRHAFQWIADHSEEVEATIASASRHRPERLALRQESKLSAEPILVLGYGGGRGEPQGAPATYEVLQDYETVATLEVRFPHAYLFPAALADIASNLETHGVVVDSLALETELEVEVYRIDSLDRAGRPVEGHRLTSVEVTPRIETLSFPAGTRVVRTAQKLGILAGYLLEPQSEDGLCAWNLFDQTIAPEGDFPVVRLLSRVTLNVR